MYVELGDHNGSVLQGLPVGCVCCVVCGGNGVGVAVVAFGLPKDVGFTEDGGALFIVLLVLALLLVEGSGFCVGTEADDDGL